MRNGVNYFFYATKKEYAKALGSDWRNLLEADRGPPDEEEAKSQGTDNIMNSEPKQKRI